MQSQMRPVACQAEDRADPARPLAEGSQAAGPVGHAAVPRPPLVTLPDGDAMPVGEDPAGVADEAPTLIWATDANGAPVYANRRFAAVFGSTAAELRQGGWGLILAPEALAE